MTLTLSLPSFMPFHSSWLNRFNRASAPCFYAFFLCLAGVSLPIAVHATSTLVPMGVHRSGGAALFTAVADVNGDGHEDVFASNTNGVVSLSLGKGSGAFQTAATIASLPAGSFYPIVTAD